MCCSNCYSQASIGKSRYQANKHSLGTGGGVGRAYGLERQETVIIGADRYILGFDEGMEPTKEVLDAV
jgi:hypothetical protein